MRKIIFLLLLFSFGIFLNSCKKDIEIPSYIHVKTPTFKVTNGQGTDVQNINHVGVYINDNLEGIFETPVTLPVLRKGDFIVEIRPYIKRLAREGLVNYTLMDGYFENATLVQGEVDTITPVFEYQNNTKFEWLDDFNANTKSIMVDTNQSTIDTIFVTNSQGPSVDNSLYAYINMGNIVDPFFSVETQDQFSLPVDGRDVYLEFHYKTSIPITVGLFEYNSSSSTRVTLPSVSPFATNGTWQKAYVYLNDELINAPAGAKYKVYFRAVNGDESILGEVFLDNLKLMYRE